MTFVELENRLASCFGWLWSDWCQCAAFPTLCCTPSKAMRFFFAFCLVLALIANNSGQTSAVLTSAEVDALNQVLLAFPSLSRPQQDPSLYDMMNGPCKPWPNDTLASVCSNGNGFDVCGVYCLQGHVGGLL